MKTWIRNHPLAALALVLAVLVGAATSAWRYTPLNEWVTAERLVGWIETFSQYWWAPLALGLAYIPAAIVIFPRPLLTVAAAMAFGPWKGFAIALGGVLATTLLGYALGRGVDPARVKRWSGPRLDRVAGALRKEGLISVASVCVLPLAPFFIEVVAFGALRLKLWHVMGGVTISNVPGLLASTLLGDQVHAVLAHDRTLNPWVLALVAALVVGGAIAARRLWTKMRGAAATAGSRS